MRLDLNFQVRARFTTRLDKIPVTQHWPSCLLHASRNHLSFLFQVFIGHSDNIAKVCFTPDLLGLVSIGEVIFIWDFLGDGRVPLEPG